MTATSLVHVAIVSFGYAPLRHVSATRAVEMAGGLARLGHPVTAVTVDWREGGDTGEDAVNVLRVDPRTWFPGFLPSGRPIRVEAVGRRNRMRTFARTLRWGPFAPWAKAALATLLAEHRRRAVSVVWAIHGDDSAHEVGYRFARTTGVPWVADFKDPWDLFHPGVARLPQFIATRRRLAAAAAITETAAAQALVDERRFARPTHVIWSGYDAVKMAAATPQSSERFSLVHLGHLGPQHNCELVADLALHLSRNGVPLDVYGHGSGTLTQHLASRAVRHREFPYTTAPFEVMKGAGALLVVPATHGPAATRGGSVGVKELECLASGTPTLCLGRLLPEVAPIAAAVGHAFSTSDAREAANWVLAQREQGVTSRGTVNHPAVAAHDWHSKASALSAVLMSVVATTHQARC